MFRLPLPAPGLAAATLVWVILDQAAKLLVVWHGLVGPTPVVPGFFNLLYRENRGGAWGLLADAPEWFRMPFFVTSSLAAVVFLVWLRRRMQIRRPWVDWAFPAILGGAVGNLIDRVRLGYVIDFIDWHVGDAHWPTFNVADVGITVGVVLLVFDSLFDPRPAPPAAEVGRDGDSEAPPGPPGEG